MDTTHNATNDEIYLAAYLDWLDRLEAADSYLDMITSDAYDDEDDWDIVEIEADELPEYMANARIVIDI